MSAPLELDFQIQEEQPLQEDDAMEEERMGLGLGLGLGADAFGGLGFTKPKVRR